MSSKEIERKIGQYYVDNYRRKECSFATQQQLYWQLVIEHGGEVPAMIEQKKLHDALFQERDIELKKCVDVFYTMKEQEQTFVTAITLVMPQYGNFCLHALMFALGVVEYPHTLCFALSDLF